MTLRESHQICQLDLERLTEPLQLYIPREEEIEEPKMDQSEATAGSPPADQSEAVAEADQSAVAMETQPASEETDQSEKPPEQGKSRDFCF